MSRTEKKLKKKRLALEQKPEHSQGLNQNIIKPHLNSRTTATNGFVVSTTICHCKHVGPKNTATTLQHVSQSNYSKYRSWRWWHYLAGKNLETSCGWTLSSYTWTTSPRRQEHSFQTSPVFKSFSSTWHQTSMMWKRCLHCTRHKRSHSRELFLSREVGDPPLTPKLKPNRWRNTLTRATTLFARKTLKCSWHHHQTCCWDRTPQPVGLGIYSPHVM